MQNRAYIFILITLMIDAIGIGLVFPIMPDLMDRVGAGGTGAGALWANFDQSDRYHTCRTLSNTITTAISILKTKANCR